MTNEIANSCGSEWTNTSDTARSARPRSHTTIVTFRLNRSARTPAAAPNRPGNILAVSGTRIPVTPPIASASAIVANRATQSPKLDARPAHQRRENGLQGF